jgi:hypothetical protein
MHRIDWFYYCMSNHLFNKKRGGAREIEAKDERRETTVVGVI